VEQMYFRGRQAGSFCRRTRRNDALVSPITTVCCLAVVVVVVVVVVVDDDDDDDDDGDCRLIHFQRSAPIVKL